MFQVKVGCNLESMRKREWFGFAVKLADKRNAHRRSLIIKSRGNDHFRVPCDIGDEVRGADKCGSDIGVNPSHHLSHLLHNTQADAICLNIVHSGNEMIRGIFFHVSHLAHTRIGKNRKPQLLL